MTRQKNSKKAAELTGAPSVPIEPDRTKPFSHNWTDIALRSLVVHPKWKKRPEILYAAKLLKSEFFKPDPYPSYQKAEYWVRFIHWWPNLLTALEIMSELGSVDIHEIMR